jgi:hypothetical protein
MSQLVSNIAEVGLYPVDDQSTKYKTLVEPQFRLQLSLGVVAYLHPTLPDLQQTIGVILLQILKLRSFTLLFPHRLQRYHMATLQRRIHYYQERAEVLV